MSWGTVVGMKHCPSRSLGSSVSHCVMRSRGICSNPGARTQGSAKRARPRGTAPCGGRSGAPCALKAVRGRGGPGHPRRNGALKPGRSGDGDWKSRAGVLRQRLVPQPRQQPRVASDLGLLFRWRVGKARGVDLLGANGASAWLGCAVFSPRGSSRPRDRTPVSCVSRPGRRILCHRATWEALEGTAERLDDSVRLPPGGTSRVARDPYPATPRE
ncbi:unnamed protein product [Rangifer tarandus platyrhynchus]|uniref:Uncharacterized protein n=4 Tax=Rangifer tarandus platyrhynchus TaxID=3082113 RepID=A0ABN8XIZ2_RANTA|nr:unnamed protein product [Rangifer tarandus platyrhynchus]CAI9149359.1 unnamed protein product [Rangifer tarandus platyrhynchus]CAI9149360.1 unnamed protein product [Rangifer tarandus platyrhynchus]CAI9163462.1 unnamed protein product [Rangifer tarandus platyrhynchus]CAI9163463.1 unnamed protein product [Rangifer tarandus platyrhynchus]